MDRQQTGNALDDDFAGQFDGTVAVVGLSLGFEAAGFLKEGQTDGRRETAGAQETRTT